MCYNITTNAGGVPYLSVTNITVGTESVDLALGFRRIQPVGYMTIRIGDAIPTGTTETLPITLTLNGTSRALTTFGGAQATVADVTGTGVITVFNDRMNGILQLIG